MTLPDALREAGHGASIRRRSWVAGFRIAWSHAQLRWIYGNMFTPSPLDPATSRELDPFDSQGCLTPMSMIADDWEVAS